jgi:hypothetical protein
MTPPARVRWILEKLPCVGGFGVRHPIQDGRSIGVAQLPQEVGPDSTRQLFDDGCGLFGFQFLQEFHGLGVGEVLKDIG